MMISRHSLGDEWMRFHPYNELTMWINETKLVEIVPVTLKDSDEVTVS